MIVYMTSCVRSISTCMKYPCVYIVCACVKYYERKQSCMCALCMHVSASYYTCIIYYNHVIMCRNSSLSKFFEQFFAVLSSLQNERDHATLMALAKRIVDIKDPVEMEYVAVLTPYALGFVSKQLALRNKVTVIHESATSFQVSSSQGILKVTTENCKCTFWNSTHLPCRHMLAVREKKTPSFI